MRQYDKPIFNSYLLQIMCRSHHFFQTIQPTNTTTVAEDIPTLDEALVVRAELFKECSNLKKVTIPMSGEYISANAFAFAFANMNEYPCDLP